MVGKDQLAGYLLEEVIAYLLRASGYRLLGESDDPRALVRTGNGLRVRGRGAEHQADALGDLAIAIPFSLPIRLFVEAKNTKKPVSLEVVRGAHGVVHDVNQHVRAEPGPATDLSGLRQVQYRYSVFSTGGFTRDAQTFALAHQISLIDLSGPAWMSMADALRKAAQRVLRLPAPAEGHVAVRHALRRSLAERDSASVDLAVADGPTFSSQVREWAEDLADRVIHSGPDDLVLGFVDAPFVLALRATDGDALRRIKQSGLRALDIRIRYAEDGPVGGDWTVDSADETHPLHLTFPLPGVLEEHLLAQHPRDVRAAASQAKELISTITVYVDGDPIALQYERIAVQPESAIPEDAKSDSLLRHVLRDERSQRPESGLIVSEPGPAETPWSAAAIHELLRRLENGQYVQAALVRAAARRGGTIGRDDIYEVANFSRRRTLRGLSRPVTRIRDELIAEDVLPADAKFPFVAVYPEGVKASYFRVPEEFVRVLSSDLDD